ncbi:hypothetical protein [Deinococcus peraridilitoris]|uniref:Uncharacterized protein n=1 Tax=Deinococcus peraridilitoris (strain DSM 19664 / LMG 22246 / CIP 109416 / KR-200) TaxID=937777 RepID=L0A0X7_DEIPD|nr:hypothetical protein [Deinococcus peraridilitoris]AFZ67553.1 hypothetical protein Deipe_2057 [Deinococcus peraridilitoris DSM 19664]
MTRYTPPTILQRAQGLVQRDRARQQLQKQTDKGISKYGQTLDTYPGDYATVLQHALEEAADLTQYLLRAADLAPDGHMQATLMCIGRSVARDFDDLAWLLDVEAEAI